MKIKEFIGSTVLDKNANVVGKVDNVDFDTATGKIETITLTLQKNLFSRDELEISFEDIATIGAYIILNKEITKEEAVEAEEAEAETVEIEIEDKEQTGIKMVFDARGLEIALDSYVRYVDTGTIGKVVDLKTQDGIEWVKLDKTELWYRSNLVELLDDKDIKKSTLYDDRDNQDLDVEAMKEKASALEDMQMDSSVAEGGG